MDEPINTDAGSNSESRPDGRYGVTDGGDAEWIVYDRQRPTVRVQSDRVVEITL